jgi:hypothetical protein
MSKQGGFNALVYLFDSVIAEKLGFSYNKYIEVMDSMTEEDSEFVLESVFEYIVLEDSGSAISIFAERDFNEAVAMFNEHAEILRNESEL